MNSVSRCPEWQRGTDRVGSGDREAVRPSAVPLVRAAQSTGEGGFKDPLQADASFVHEIHVSSDLQWL